MRAERLLPQPGLQILLRQPLDLLLQLSPPPLRKRAGVVGLLCERGKLLPERGGRGLQLGDVRVFGLALGLQGLGGGGQLLVLCLDLLLQALPVQDLVLQVDNCLLYTSPSPRDRG